MPDHDETPDDRVAALLERTLSSRAASATAPPDLAIRARARSRHRAVLRRAATGAAGLAVAASIAIPMTLAGGDPEPVTAADTPATTPTATGAAPDTPVYSGLPPLEPAADGWRWETYQGVELQVPADWQSGGTTGTQWCGEPGAAYVGRPGALPANLCVASKQVPPENQQRYVWFGGGQLGGDAVVGRETFAGGWIRETREVGGLLISAQLDDEGLADRIFDSARVISDVDAIGCALTYAGTDTLDARPTTGALDRAQVGPDGAVCQYSLGYDIGPAMLTGSYRMPADDVAAFVAAVDAAPAGSGPDSPPDCTPDHRRGDEAVLVRVPTTDGLREVVVWYAAGCGNGADDGVTLHTLTPDLLRPLFQGAVQASSFSMAVAPLMQQAEHRS